MPSQTGRHVRGAGTVLSRTMITGGAAFCRASAHTRIIRGRENRRPAVGRTTCRYPGRNRGRRQKSTGTMPAPGFVAGRAWPSSLNIGAISRAGRWTPCNSRAISDRKPPIRATAHLPAVGDHGGRRGSRRGGESVFTVQSDTFAYHGAVSSTAVTSTKRDHPLRRPRPSTTGS